MDADSMTENTPKVMCPICLPKLKSLEFQWKKASLGVRSPWLWVLKIRERLMQFIINVSSHFSLTFLVHFAKKWTPTAACIPRMIRFWIFSFEFPSFGLTDKNTSIPESTYHQTYTDNLPISLLNTTYLHVWRKKSLVQYSITSPIWIIKFCLVFQQDQNIYIFNN